ncbi:DNA polymerase III subunit beta [Sutcliffiella horikoshii]|uniref:DNA polymerase III subunit beta n=1 Tax=Sutcliffiella horikoshii TaxID=79883 RepID=UPI00203EE16D|nr:DNA polymerase III subunit beta [Sutcliffiella horikoshii]MCM3619711.1 DNA polymerase III subunit beta [Sutcliffiella horikoshii]
MQFTINKEVLLEGLNKVMKVVSPKHSILILQGILFEVTMDKLVLTGSDATETIRYSIPADDKNLTILSEGKAVLPKNVVEISKKLKKEIQVSSEGTNCQIVSGKSDFNIITLDADEYPKFNDFHLNSSPTVTYSGNEFRDLIRKTAFSASTSEVRPLLTGICLEVANGYCRLVCTDSHRLSRVSKPTKSDKELKLVIPAKSLDNASKVFSDEEVDLYHNGQQVLFRNGNTLYLSRLLEGNYPDTSRLIPTEHKSKLTIKRSELYDGLDILKGLSLSADDNKGGIVKLHINGAAHLSTNQSQKGKGKIEIPYDAYEGEEDFTISFNVKYLQDALKSIDKEQVELCFNGQMRPFVVVPDEEELQLILPVRTA